MLEFLADIETEARTARAEKMTKYRELLSRAIPPATLATHDQHRLAALIKELALPGEIVHQHAQALQEIARIEAMQTKLADLQKQRTGIEPDLATFVEKRQRLLAELEKEGGPIWGRAAELERAISQAAAQLAGNNADRVRNEHREFFAIVAPAERPRANQGQIEESNRRASIWNSARPLVSTLADGKPRGKEWNDRDHSVVTMAFRFGREASPDPLVFAPGTGWPRDDDPRFAPGVGIDPRYGKITRRVRELTNAAKAGSVFWADLEKDPLVQHGIYLGFVSGDKYIILPNPDARAGAAEEAQEQAQT